MGQRGLRLVVHDDGLERFRRDLAGEQAGDFAQPVGTRFPSILAQASGTGSGSEFRYVRQAGCLSMKAHRPTVKSASPDVR